MCLNIRYDDYFFFFMDKASRTTTSPESYSQAFSSAALLSFLPIDAAGQWKPAHRMPENKDARSAAIGHLCFTSSGI